MNGALLGPQRETPTVEALVESLGIGGPIALITAGWQEREDQDDALHQGLGGRTVNLNLYRRGEEVFAQDAEYAALHRARQDRLRQRQDFYRLRLERSVDAALHIKRLSADSAYAQDEEQQSIDSIRTLDADHLAQCRATREDFEAQARPFEREAIAAHRAELEQTLSASKLLLIAGGHVAVLLNRLRMFGIAQLLDGQTLVAWSGGAMVTGERIVLFHESPPQGAGVSEVMDEGLGLHQGILPLPNPRMRLKLEDSFRVGWMAKRHAPQRCIALDFGESVRFSGSRWFAPSGTQWLKADGSVSPEWTS